MQLQNFTKKTWVKLAIEATDKKGVIAELFHLINEEMKFHNSESILEAICQREQLMSTGIGHGVAVPHARSEDCKNFHMAVGISPDGINFNTIDGESVKIIVLIIGPADKPNMHIKILSQVSKLLYSQENRSALLKARTADEILRVFSIEI